MSLRPLFTGPLPCCCCCCFSCCCCCCFSCCCCCCCLGTSSSVSERSGLLLPTIRPIARPCSVCCCLAVAAVVAVASAAVAAVAAGIATAALVIAVAAAAAAAAAPAAADIGCGAGRRWSSGNPMRAAPPSSKRKGDKKQIKNPLNPIRCFSLRGGPSSIIALPAGTPRPVGPRDPRGPPPKKGGAPGIIAETNGRSIAGLQLHIDMNCLLPFVSLYISYLASHYYPREPQRRHPGGGPHRDNERLYIQLPAAAAAAAR